MTITMSDAYRSWDLTGRRRGWPTVAVRVDPQSTMASLLHKLAMQKKWRLLSLAKFSQQLPDGISLKGAIVSDLSNEWPVPDLLGRGIPVVRIGNWPHRDDPLVPAVLPDRAAMGMMAADHFAERDFKHVAFIGRSPWGNNQGVYDAFAARSKDLGMMCHLLQLGPSVRAESVRGDLAEAWSAREEHFVDWIKALPLPVGLLAFNSPMADRYCYWLTESGLRVPEDVAIIALGNDAFTCECASVPITSVAFDFELTASTAVELLDRMLKGNAIGQTTVMIPPSGMICRQSTDVLAATDPRVKEALRYMWDHVTEDLSVDHIAKHVGVARRTLEKAFLRELGRGINMEFQRRRLDKSRELLELSNIPVHEVARILSFSGAQYFCRVFKRVYGVTPLQYRQQHQKVALVGND